MFHQKEINFQSLCLSKYCQDKTRLVDLKYHQLWSLLQLCPLLSQHLFQMFCSSLRLFQLLVLLDVSVEMDFLFFLEHKDGEGDVPLEEEGQGHVEG